jgi:hypothetical protein
MLKDEPKIAKRYVLEPRRQPGGLSVVLADPRTGREWQFSRAEELWIFLSRISRRGLR